MGVISVRADGKGCLWISGYRVQGNLAVMVVSLRGKLKVKGPGCTWRSRRCVVLVRMLAGGSYRNVRGFVRGLGSLYGLNDFECLRQYASLTDESWKSIF